MLSGLGVVLLLLTLHHIYYGHHHHLSSSYGVSAASVQSPRVQSTFVRQTSHLVETLVDGQDGSADTVVRYVPTAIALARSSDAIATGNTDTLAFTRFEFILASDVGNVFGAFQTATTKVYGTRAEPTLHSTKCPSDRVCRRYVEPVQVSVFASRPIFQYSLEAMGVEVPFAFVHGEYTNATSAAPGCLAAAGDCDFDRVARHPTDRTCDADTIATEYRGYGGPSAPTDNDAITAQLDASCGVHRDPDNGFQRNLCLSACCYPCSNPGGRLDYRTKHIWQTGPVCQMYRISERPRVVMDIYASLRTGSNVLDQLLLLSTNRTAPDDRVLRPRTGSMSPGPAALNANRTMRVVLTDHSTTETFSSGLVGQIVVICDYNMDEQPGTPPGPPYNGDGVYNPYLAEAFAQVTTFPGESAAFARIALDANDTADGPSAAFFEAVGAGHAPTYRLRPNNASASWFVIGKDHAEYLQSRTQLSIMGHYGSDMSAMCDPVSSPWDTNVGVPGLDASAPFPTPCQMSAAINNYTAVFNSTLLATLNTDAAYAAVGNPDRTSPPLGLARRFASQRPNMWIHGGNALELLYDPLADDSTNVAFVQIAVDIPTHRLPIQRTPSEVTLGDNGATCAINAVAQRAGIEQVLSGIIPAAGPSPLVEFQGQVTVEIIMTHERVPGDSSVAFAVEWSCSTALDPVDTRMSVNNSITTGSIAYPVQLYQVGDRRTIEFVFSLPTTELSPSELGSCRVIVYEYDTALPKVVPRQYDVDSFATTCMVVHTTRDDYDDHELEALAAQLGLDVPGESASNGGGNNDDFIMPWWGYLLIILGILACCALCIVVFVIAGKDKDPPTNGGYTQTSSS